MSFIRESDSPREVVLTIVVILAVIGLLLLGTVPAWAQDHRPTVERIRRELTARGVIPAGIVNPGQNENPCAVHQITRRVAWELRAEGWGLLEKSSGNHCEWRGQRYSMDFVVQPDGRSVDIAVGGEFDGVTTDAAPSWHIETIPSHVGRWRAPLEPEETPSQPPPVATPPPPVTPPPVTPPPVIVQPPTTVDLSPVLVKLAEIDATTKATREDTKVLREGMDRVWKAIAKYGAPIVGALLAGRYAIPNKPAEEPAK